jgi:hypothetical protein
MVTPNPLLLLHQYTVNTRMIITNYLLTCTRSVQAAIVRKLIGLLRFDVVVCVNNCWRKPLTSAFILVILELL